MKTYEFTLIFDVSAASAPSDELVESLGEAGCDDAIVGVGRPGRLALAFDREADTAQAAVMSALAGIMGAIPQAVLVEAAPDFVGITEVAKLVGRSRQNIRKLLASCGALAPAPVHEGNPSLWHLADLLGWLAEEKGYSVERELIDLADVTKQLNIAVAQRSADDSLRGNMARLLG